MSLRKTLILAGGLVMAGSIGAFAYTEGRDYSSNTKLYTSLAFPAGLVILGIGATMSDNNRNQIEYRDNRFLLW